MMLAIDAVGARDHHGRRAEEGRPARPRAAGVRRPRRLPVRLLHPRLRRAVAGAAGRDAASPTARRSSTACAATSAAAPRTCGFSTPSKPPRKEAGRELPSRQSRVPGERRRPARHRREGERHGPVHDRLLPAGDAVGGVHPLGLRRLRGCASSDVEAAKAVKGVLEVELDKRRGPLPRRPPGPHLCRVAAGARGRAGGARPAVRRQLAAHAARGRAHAGRRARHRPTTTPTRRRCSTTRDVVVEAEYQTQVQTHCRLEPHGAVVHFRGDSAVGYGSTQSNQSFRNDLARELELRPDQVEFHCEYVGGGFGAKFGADSEGVLAARLSKKYSRPVRVICNRKEEHLDTGNRPGSIQSMKIGVNRDGKMRGGKIHHVGLGRPHRRRPGQRRRRGRRRRSQSVALRLRHDRQGARGRQPQRRLPAGDAGAGPSAGDVRHRADDGPHRRRARHGPAGVPPRRTRRATSAARCSRSAPR